MNFSLTLIVVLATFYDFLYSAQRGDREAESKGALHEDALGREDRPGQGGPRSPRHHQKTERRGSKKERRGEKRWEKEVHIVLLKVTVAVKIHIHSFEDENYMLPILK